MRPRVRALGALSPIHHAAATSPPLPLTVSRLCRNVFYAGMILMAASSSAYHLMRHKSKEAFNTVYACDLGGIVVICAASFNWTLHLAFLCAPRVCGPESQPQRPWARLTFAAWPCLPAHNNAQLSAALGRNSSKKRCVRCVPLPLYATPVASPLHGGHQPAVRRAAASATASVSRRRRRKGRLEPGQAAVLRHLPAVGALPASRCTSPNHTTSTTAQQLMYAAACHPAAARVRLAESNGLTRATPRRCPARRRSYPCST